MVSANPKANGGGQDGQPKNPKKSKTEEEKDDDKLDYLLVNTEKEQTSYLNLKTGGFVTKGADRKSRLDKRQAQIVATRADPDDDDDEETEQEKLEREARELSSQLKKAERAEALACDKEERDKAKRYSAHIA